MIEDVLISGQLGKAIYTDGGRYFVLGDNSTEPTECRPMDFSTFFNFGAEIRPFSPHEKPGLTGLRQEIAEQRKERRALTLAINGMDSDLDKETRLNSIEWAEKFMKEERPRRFVRARMLGLPLPHEADVGTARDLANRAGATLLGSLYETIKSAEEIVTLVHETWNELTSASFVSSEKQIEATSKLIDLGLFADTTTSLVAGNVTALHSLVVAFAQIPIVSQILPQSPLLLDNFIHQLLRKTNPPAVANWRRNEPTRQYRDSKKSRTSDYPRSFRVEDAGSSAGTMTNANLALSRYAEGLQSIGHSESAGLVFRITEGDARAEAELVSRYSRGVSHIIRHLVRNDPIAEDILQDTFLTVIRKIRKGDLIQSDSLGAFIASIARSNTSDLLRKVRKRAENEVLDDVKDIPDPALTPLEQLQRTEQSEAIQEVIEELRPRYRELLVRFYLTEEPKDRICADLGLTSMQFDGILHRARNRFKALYQKRK